MSATYQVTIWCDECGNWEQLGTHSVNRARGELKKKGWSFRKRQDLCPKCTTYYEEEKQRDPNS